MLLVLLLLPGLWRGRGRCRGLCSWLMRPLRLLVSRVLLLRLLLRLLRLLWCHGWRTGSPSNRGLPLQAAKHRARRWVAGRHAARALHGRHGGWRCQRRPAVQAGCAPLLRHGIPLPLRRQAPGGHLPQLPPLLVAGRCRGARGRPLKAPSREGRSEAAGQW